MILAATFIILIVVALYAWHCHRLIDHAESRARRAWADHEQVVASKDEALTHLRGIVNAVVAENRSLAEMRDLEHTKHAIVLAELERHEAEHCCLPTLDGIRGHAPLAVVPDNVTRLRGRGRA